MGLVVRYRTADGDERWEDVADLDAAVSRVERLRNDEGLDDVRVYRQLPLEFRPYYRVEVVGDARSAPAGAVVPPPGAMPLASTAPPATTVKPDAVAKAEADGDGRKPSIFNRHA